MKSIRILPVTKFAGSPKIPGDKSISHRGLIFGALASGQTEIKNLLVSEDIKSTMRVLSQFGVKIKQTGPITIIEGLDAARWKKVNSTLDCGNSGTTMRLMMGVLAGIENIEVELSGDASLVRRPMKRVAVPLSKMGAKIVLSNGDFAPMKIFGQPLRAFDLELKLASAQIKSAIILAAASARGETRIRGAIQSRDHTEILFRHFGGQIEIFKDQIIIAGNQKFRGAKLLVPGDPSAAAFWLAAAALVPNGRITLENVSLNPTRLGMMNVLERMGANISYKRTQDVPELIGEISLSYSPLKGVEIRSEEIPFLIDELPILAVLASQAKGQTRVRGAEELRVKETDRIQAIAHNLRLMSVQIETTNDGFVIEGPQKLKGARIESFHDHRIAMAFGIAALVADSESVIQDFECVRISYPDFFSTLSELSQ